MDKISAERERAIEIIELARKQHADNELDIDYLPACATLEQICKCLSEGDDNGAWVRAWVWVDFTNTPFNKDEEQPDE